MSKYETISEILENRATQQGVRPAYVFLSYGEAGMVEERLTYAELDARARAIGASLQAAGAIGERVALLLPPGPDFISSFFGCLYAGAVAVPALPPRRRGVDPRLRAICRDARPRVALTTPDQLPALESAAAEIPELSAACRMAPAPEGDADWQRPEPRPEALAFLQYTSGSTSSPKGVMVSHSNLLHNEELIRHTFAQSSGSVVLGWLPLYHDMGLIGTLLQPVYTGAVCYLMTPGAFLQRPARWLEAISRYRATTSGGPNFAYELCVRKVGAAQREGLDLSSWQVAFNGAEPVRAGTLRRFAAAFASCGFRASAFRPCYGLAEATLLVSGRHQEGEPRMHAFDAEALERHEAADAGDPARSRDLVSCGATVQTVVAVDPESGVPSPPGRVGEIWVGGPSVAQGYWERPEETVATFGACLADGTGPFLRTGDLGFVFEGELFLTGRLKDLIILRGRNHYPQDLELTAESSHAGLRAGGAAAFAVDLAGEERLVIVHEVERHACAGMEGKKTEEIAAAVRRGVAEEHEVSVAEVVLIRPETLPRTSSGKVQRHVCRDLYLQGRLRVLGASRLSLAAADEDPRVDVQVGSPDWLRRAFAAAARIDPDRIDADLPLSSTGLDSLAAVELKHRVEEVAGFSLPFTDLLEGMTLRELARRVAGGETMAAMQLPPGTGEAVGEHALSWNQRSLWFLHRLAPESSAYNIAGAARLGPVSSEALNRALQGLVDRHPMLRATFADTPEGPVQRVGERGVAGFEAVDADGWSDAEVDTRLHAEAYRPFDLATGPLLRAVLLRRGGETFLALAVHHIAADFWSMALLAREFGALVAGEAPSPPAALYIDFARRQERMLESSEGERLWEHWRERLTGTPQLDLPTDRQRRPVQGLRGGGRTLPPSPERAEAVHRLAATYVCTPFVALLAAWQAVLSRWSGQEEFIAGAPMAGRSAREWGEVVGYFVNLVPLRADLSGDPAVRDLMARTRGTVLDALAHQDLPFALLAERLQPERDLSRPPLVAAMLTFEKAPGPELAAFAAFAVGVPGVRLDLGGLVLETLSLEPPTAQLDLSLTAAELPGGLALSLQWDADLFDAATAGRMLGHLDRLIAEMVVADRPVAELPLLADGERDQILRVWSGAESGEPAGTGCLHELFEAQAARTPEATALVFGEERWTYQDLNRRANRLAHHLRRLGAGPEQRVGVLMGRSGELITVLLGILKAGAAYVPLDPAYPKDWLAFAAEDARIDFLLTGERWTGKLPGRREIDAAGEAISREPEGNPEPLACSGNLAYVIYTSGSMGRPKGVALEHRSSVERMHWARAIFPAADLAGVLAATSICFDLSVFEIFTPLSWGGTVILAGGVLELPVLPARGEVTLINTVPSAMAELAAGELPPAVRTVNLAGEALPPRLAARIYRHPQVERVLNLYGPTEDTTYSTGARVERGAGRVSIGRPLPGTRAYVLDGSLKPVPGGVPGELFLAGAGGARGYLGRPDLTAERFLPDPFAARPGGRLYRTGDLARWLASGDLEHLGRLDHQVKIRGFRIELAEIESVLGKLPGVREAVVVARDSPAGDRRLVAYMAGDMTPNGLLQSLRERLPEHMVPFALVTLPALPLTPNGKVDRKALPAPEWERAEESFLAPRTPVEEVVAGIWAELLGLERVGAADHFFALGGHSLLAARVVSRLRRAFGVELPVRDLFEAPTVEALAARVEAARRTGAILPAPPLLPAPREGALPLSFAQQRLWFIAQLEPDSPLYNMPGALWAEGLLDGAVLALCLGEIARRHEALRTVFAAPEGLPVQVIQPVQPFPLPVVDLSGLPEGVREALALTLIQEEAGRPFDLTRGPLLRGLLVRVAERDHAVGLTLHHIVGDGWSLGLLIREIAALYPVFAARLPSPLPELPVQYADFAVWQRSWLRGEVLEQEIAWWRRQLAGLPPLLELPTDRPRPAAQSYRGANRPVRLPAGLTRELETLARREGATLFMVLLAAFQSLLARASGQDDLAVGSPVAGRGLVETEDLIGFFVNTLVLRSDLAGAPAFRELLGRVRETALAAYLHQDVPFEKLVEELAPERSLAHGPLFQVMLVLQNAPVGSLEIEALCLRPMGDTGTLAKFDLTLNLSEYDGGLVGTVEYATDLFDAATVDRLILHYERLLTAALAAPERLVAELPLLSPAERHQAITEWNDTVAPPVGEVLLHDLLTARAEQAPELPALVQGQEQLTHGELAARSDRLAAHLRALGAGPDVLVAIFLERSVDLVVALLAVLKAGGAYLPLETSLPGPRLSFMLDDSGAPFLLTRTGLLPALPEHSCCVVCLDDLPEIADDGGQALRPAADNLAYVLYTSGSTGTPKGVAIPHRGLANYLLWAMEAYPVGKGRGAPVHSPIGFDLTVTSLFLPLLAGRRVDLVPEEDGVEGLAAALAEGGFGLVKLTPAHLDVLQRLLPPERVAGCAEAFVLGGEPLSGEQLAFWRLHAPGLRLINEYGPTETVVGCCAYEIPASVPPAGPVPIGRPIANTRILILDPELFPVPVGTPGELYIGGAGLCRGYLHRPDLTAERLVPDLFGMPGERLYRTGDLARRLPDGRIEFLGRSDHQVKIRGFRIELGEIEAALVSVSGVREAVVLARADRSLVAYVVGAIAVEELRRSLRERLPDYMIPAAFVTLAALPLTANGKVDREALPAPQRQSAPETYLAPRTPVEEVLAGIWAQVLRLPRVGVNDNFFEMGGDSILSVQIVARARQAGLRFTVRQIFEHQTVAELARHATAIETSVHAGQGTVLGEVPLTPIQRWFFAQGFADPHHFNQALLLESREPLAPAALERAMAALVEHHDALRMRFDFQRQENAPGEPVTPFCQVDLSGLPAPRWREAFDRAAAALQAGFHLSAGPLTRLCLFNVFKPARLLWVTHHLVVDGVSWRVLLEDLEGAYRQSMRGLHPALPPKTTSFQEWARGLTARAGSEALAGELDYWRETVRIPVPRLPVDFPAADDLVGDEATVSFELGADETSDLLQTLPSVYHNRIDDALLSALVRALAGWTGSPRLRVDLEGHGREPIFGDIDVSRTVGWFTSLYPVVLEGGDAGAGEALVSAKERLRAVPERGIGYGLLRYLRNAEDVDNGDAEISFNYLGQVDAASGERSLFRASPASAGSTRSPRGHRTHPLEIVGIVMDGRLRITLTYGSRTHRRETAERLAAAYAGTLRQLIQHGRESEEVFTPSDFAKAGLDVHSFNKLASLLSDPVESMAGGLGLTLKNVADVYSLSPAQSGMLFHCLMAPESGVYVTQVTCTLPADLDGRLFRQAWERLVERHEVLRTAFLWAGLDEPLQVVRKSCALPWQDLDWRGLFAEEQRRRYEEMRHRDRHTPLPLTRAPLMRFSLIRLDCELVFIWTSHHLLLDGWSLPILFQELGSVYAALREGWEPASPTLPPARPFSDYIVWLQRQSVSRAEPFWRQELAGFTTPNSLGILGIAPPVGAEGASDYAEHGIRLSREVTAELQYLAARHKLTLQTVTLGAWAVLVSRYSGEEDVVFGSAVSGRPAALPGVETMVGMFVNTLPVRVRVNDAEPLAAWLQRLQERQLARQEFEHTPLAQIQRWSEVPAGSPLFETLYAFENYPDAEAGGDGPSGSLGIGNLQSFESTNYPLSLALTAADQVALYLASDRARVDGDAALRLLQHLATLLAGVAEGVQRSAGELGLLTAAERRQILGEWNDTRAEGITEACLHQEVAVQAARTPSALAVEMGPERWTYRRLIGSARRLARHLRELGVSPDSIVGLCTERSPAMVVGMLAVLEAGGAWLPLDPSYPAERLAFMLEDAGARVLLVQESLLKRMPVGSRHVVLLDERWDSGEDMGQPLRTDVTPSNLAYIIYTSGSTGQPKGVMVTHRGVCNRLRWALEVYRLDERDAFLQKASFGFDVSVWECFAPLLAGARLVLAEPGGQGDGAYLTRAIREHRITFIDFAPSMLTAFLAEEDVEKCVSLRQVVVGGETLAPELRDRMLARLPVPLDNMYGATEVTIDTTRWVCAPGQAPYCVPIGRPIANSRLYVVDPEVRPVPVGVTGELLMGGAGVTRGYLRRPDLTAERFVPDPFGDQPGDRLYRTGDLVRWLPDGALDFLGRLDHQVKVRGFRIELGEIETALVALPGVREAVVLVREDAGDRLLVAYVVGDIGGIAVEELRRSLREQLRERLPDYMVPAAFVALAALPLTANDKVDRKALLALEAAPEQPGPREGYMAPRTREEEIIAAVWAQILRLPRVGVNDNFFELGGDSILSVQIVARARQAGLLFTVRHIFEHQTVAGLARHAMAADPASAAPARQEPVAGEVPLTPIQSWFFKQGFADLHHFNHALLLEPREPLVPAALERAIATIVEHHDALRMRFDIDPDGGVGGWRQENAPAEPVAPFHQVDLSGLPMPRRGDALERAAAALQAGFDLSAGPLTRLCLFNVFDGFNGGAGQPVRLFWVTHHLVVDGVSWRVLLEDLEGAYRQAARGLRPTLPPKTTSFQEWARRLAGHAGSEALARELDHWSETARVTVPRLPVDFPSDGTSEAGNLAGDEASVSFELTTEETSDLLQTLPSVYHNRIDDALLSALVRALAGWTGSPRLRVDLEGHGREPIFGEVDDLDVSRTVGWFTSQYPVVLERGDAGPGESLVSAKERLRAVPGRGIGYGLLRYLRNGEAARLLEAAPEAEISFNYLGQADTTSEERSLFRASTASAGSSRSPRGHRTHPLEIVGIVMDGRLRITLTYGSRTHRRETAERLAEAYAGALRQLIQQSRAGEEVFTPSDFPKAGLDARSFDKLEALLAESD